MARNIGARNSRGPILFFIDADCVVGKDTLHRVEEVLLGSGPGTVIGGTYTAVPFDRDFFSRFQSAFIRFFETKRRDADYIAGHAMAMHAETFRRSGGFPERFLPIIEDVELSHRLKRQGCRLVMDPSIEVTHIFNFTLLRSFRNAFRKSFYWTRYSLGNSDLAADSGTASRELKINVVLWPAAACCVAAGLLSGNSGWLVPAAAAGLVDIVLHRGMIRAFRRWGGPWFAVRAFAYYAMVYPVPVAAGAGAAALISVGLFFRMRFHPSARLSKGV